MIRILIVDDNPEQLNLLDVNVRKVAREMALAKTAHWEPEIVLATNTAEAEEIIRCQAFDLIVADLRMVLNDKPEKVAGLVILDLARKLDPNTPVIIVTNYSTPEVSKTAMDHGAFEFLDRNPASIDFWPMLRAKVRWALTHRELLLRSQ